MPQKSYQNKPGRDRFILVLLIIIIGTALAMRIVSHFQKAAGPAPMNQAMPLTGATLPPNDEQASPPEADFEETLTQTIPLINISGMQATGTVTYLRTHGTTTYELSAQLPQITQTYEYGVWLLSRDDNMFHRLGRLSQNAVGQYVFSSQVDRSDVTYQQLIVALEFVHASSTPGKIFLEAELPI